MTQVISSSTNNVLLIPGTPFTTRRNECLKRCNLSRNSTRQTWSSQKYVLPMLTSVRSFPQFRSGFVLQNRSRIHIVSATGTDLAVEEADSPVANEASTDAVGTSEESSVKSDANVAPAQSKRSRESRPARKSEMPRVKPEELVPGATFTGKVRSIQQYGAFVDFGAFTDGLVHVSQLSDSFVKDVGEIVSVGQEVKVRLLEANKEAGRISLSMRESDDVSKTGGESRPPRKSGPRSNQRREDMKKTKFVKGQDLEGTVKNLTRSGAFISLPEGEEGFLPSSEEVDDGFPNIMGGSSLEAGQEVSVRVLKITRGQVTLTMKREEAGGELDSKLNQGVIHAATNPFMLAFRKNKDISAFLDEREKEAEPAESSRIPQAPAGMEGKLSQTEDDETTSKEVDVEASTAESASNEIAEGNKDPENIVSDSSDGINGSVQSIEEVTEVKPEILAPEESVSSSDQLTEEAPAVDGVKNDGESDLQSADSVAKIIEEKVEVSSEVLSPEQDGSSIEEVSTTDGLASEEKADLSRQVADPVMSDNESGKEESLAEDVIANDEIQILTPNAANEILAATVAENEEQDGSAIEEVSTTDGLASEQKADLSGQVAVADPIMSDSETSKEESQADDVIAKDEIQIPIPNAANEILAATIAENEEVGSNPDKIGSITSSSGQIDVPAVPQSTNKEIQVSEEVENKAEEDLKDDTPAAESEIPSAILVVDQTMGSVPDSGTVTDSNGQSAVSSPKESTTKAAISPALVKQLREETGAGMMDCKKALSETGGDLVKAQEFLRKKGLASADKKASRATAEGRIGAYIHDSRIGVLIEVNCETDFVSRGDIFKELVDDLAMQVAACPQVQYLVTDDVPKEIVEKEREIEMQKEDLLLKPEQIRSKIVDGRIKKRLEEVALLEQPYIKNDKLVVKDWVKQTIATIGENMKVKRFVRFNLGEGLKKKSQDFAAEVAAQTAAKAVASPVKEQPAVVEAKETVEKPKATVSAALVKQLRDETGAGMMDCKKALSETEGDLEKAQDYLRKKGLSSADKKSSRLAAEGRIGSYIHDSRIGVLIEVNCETDFVGRSENFKELVDDLAMQVAACPQVQYVSIEDIEESIVSKEKELEMQREDLKSKPENIREKIVEGRIAKRLGELALLEQPFIKDDGILVKDLVKQTVAALGENIKVRRFVRFTLGETNESAETKNEA